jgi:hypothetical protein
MDTMFKYPIPCKVIGHSIVPEDWPGEVVGMAHMLLNEDGFGLLVRFNEPVPKASLMSIWLLALDNVETVKSDLASQEEE